MNKDRIWQVIEEDVATLQLQVNRHFKQAARWADKMMQPDFPDVPDDEFLIECLARFEAGQSVDLDLAEKAISYFQMLSEKDPLRARHINTMQHRRSNSYQSYDGRVFFHLSMRKPKWPERKALALLYPLAVKGGVVQPVRKSGYELKGALTYAHYTTKGLAITGSTQLNIRGNDDGDEPVVVEFQIEEPGTTVVKVQGAIGRPSDKVQKFLHANGAMQVDKQDLLPENRRRQNLPRRLRRGLT